MNNTNDTLTNEGLRKMIREWLTGDDERDAQTLRRTFRATGATVADWRKMIAETKSQ
jgi:hypothetical protein